MLVRIREKHLVQHPLWIHNKQTKKKTYNIYSVVRITCSCLYTVMGPFTGSIIAFNMDLIGLLGMACIEYFTSSRAVRNWPLFFSVQFKRTISGL